MPKTLQGISLAGLQRVRAWECPHKVFRSRSQRCCSPFPAPAKQTQCAETASEERERGGKRCWSNSRFVGKHPDHGYAGQTFKFKAETVPQEKCENCLWPRVLPEGHVDRIKSRSVIYESGHRTCSHRVLHLHSEQAIAASHQRNTTSETSKVCRLASVTDAATDDRSHIGRRTEGYDGVIISDPECVSGWCGTELLKNGC